MRTITIANLKGGSGKTTSAAYVAHAFQQLRRSVLIVDADPQAQLLSWSERAEFSIPAVWLPRPDIHRQLPGITGRRYDVAVIDTPPLYDPAKGGRTPTAEQRQAHGIVISAIRAADAVLVPLAPTMMELERVPAVLEAIELAASYRDDGGPAVRLVLNRTVWNATSTRVIRRALTALGCQVLATEIRNNQTLAQAYAAPVTGKLHGYLSVAQDMENAK
jgi:chromosome partitioning protein